MSLIEIIAKSLLYTFVSPSTFVNLFGPTVISINYGKLKIFLAEGFDGKDEFEIRQFKPFIKNWLIFPLKKFFKFLNPIKIEVNENRKKKKLRRVKSQIERWARDENEKDSFNTIVHHNIGLSSLTISVLLLFTEFVFYPLQRLAVYQVADIFHVLTTDFWIYIYVVIMVGFFYLMFNQLIGGNFVTISFVLKYYNNQHLLSPPVKEILRLRIGILLLTFYVAFMSFFYMPKQLKTYTEKQKIENTTTIQHEKELGLQNEISKLSTSIDQHKLYLSDSLSHSKYIQENENRLDSLKEELNILKEQENK